MPSVGLWKKSNARIRMSGCVPRRGRLAQIRMATAAPHAAALTVVMVASAKLILTTLNAENACPTAKTPTSGYARARGSIAPTATGTAAQANAARILAVLALSGRGPNSRSAGQRLSIVLTQTSGCAQGRGRRAAIRTVIACSPSAVVQRALAALRNPTLRTRSAGRWGTRARTPRTGFAPGAGKHALRNMRTACHHSAATTRTSGAKKNPEFILRCANRWKATVKTLVNGSAPAGRNALTN
mmetsp:Transcript_22761/g.37689  ORF Transcript_22761/g.37689 Transcript_22761/m.37689 type:complete len:242 (+) Transcript_22761:710-1435(+)